MSPITQSPNHPIVETHDLRKQYKMGKAEVHALNGVSLSVARGEFISIMGRSGSGKSTLLNLIGCLDRPTSGSVTIDGLVVSALAPSQLPKIRREKIGFVFQQFNLLPTLTALENVMLPLRYAGVSSRERASRAREALARVGLKDRVQHRPPELSGGEQQRVAVARAIVTRPAIILGDEPTGELDTHTAREIIAMLHKFNREFNQTIIIVTHDPMIAERTDRIVRLTDGQIESEVKTGQVSET